jgi:predicted TIM-barrel fold metal-dependent hydrolase
MQMNDMVIISVDDHIIEPPDVFANHVPAKWRDKAPAMAKNAKGVDAWRYEGTFRASFALNAVAGRPKDELGFEPESYDQIRPGCWQVDARIGDMNVNGVAASLCFGTFPGFSGETFFRASDKEAALVMLKAYNDWHIDEWCAAYPGRFIPLSLIPLWDPALAAEELARVAKKGVTTFAFPPIPSDLGLPSIHDKAWYPLWSAAETNGLTPCIHIGMGGGSVHTSLDSPVDSMLTKVGLCSFTVASEWLWSRTLRDFKTMKIVLSEGSIGWIPYFLERADLVMKNHGPWTRQDHHFNGRLPSEVFRERFFSCFIEDKVGLQMRDVIGIDTITFENDYPHADVTWPHSPEQLWSDLQETGCSPEDIDKITHLNAQRALNYDVVDRLGGRSKCDVGALRALAREVDLTIRHNVGGKPPHISDDYFSAKDMMAQLA